MWKKIYSRRVLKVFASRKPPSIYVFRYFPFGFEGRMWDLIVSVPDHCLSFYFKEGRSGYSKHNFFFRLIKILLLYLKLICFIS